MKARNIFTVSSRLQRRYLRLIVFSMLTPTLFVGGCLYYLVFSLIAQEMAIPEFVFQVLLPALKRVNIFLITGIPVIFLALYWWGLVLSHRLAGPIERFNKELDQILEGDYKKRIRVRKNDALRPFVDDINRLLDKLEGVRD
ncbi:MAG: methyl-accepting chemotaxis protein [Candidatus Omnitrophica bacterium]|nr:methyl-accepting chemotaxis protein [Candidatus Omnitrophota bacterium]